MVPGRRAGHPGAGAAGVRAALAICAVLVGSAGGSALAFADGLSDTPGSFPQIGGEVLVEVQADRTRGRGGGEGDTRILFATIEPAIQIRFTPRLSLHGALVFEPVVESPGRHHDFDEQGLLVEQLYLEYATERWGVRAGKINPSFGIAPDRAAGIYGADFAEDCEIAERIGVGGFTRFGNERVGLHRISADLFFLDTSPLSRSAFMDRGRGRRSDGGPSNTGSLRSFAIALEGEPLPGLPGFAYQIGFSRQAAGRAGRTESGYALALSHRSEPLEDIRLDLVSEYVHRLHAHGEAGDRRDFTQSAELRWKNWNAALVYSRRNVRPFSGDVQVDAQVQVSVGYAFGFGLGIDLGWRSVREDGVRRTGPGARLGYRFEF